MQQIKTAAAIFCTACICAELIAQLTGSGWARRCIKAVAGLYILTAALQAVPQIGTEWQAFSLPAGSAVSLGTLEETVLTQTEEELAQELEARCRDQLGVPITLTVQLEKTAQGVSVASVQAAAEAGCSEDTRQAAEQLLQQELGVLPEWSTTPGGEGPE